MQTYRGNIKLLALAILAAGGAFYVFTQKGTVSEDAVKEVASGAAQVAANKGKDIVGEKKDEVMEAGKQIVEEKTGEVMQAGKDAMDGAVDKVVEGGKEAVSATVDGVGSGMVRDAKDAMGIDSATGTFEDYAAEKIASNDKVIIDFAAEWCPSCRAFEKNVNENLSLLPSDVTILKADFDTETELRKKYGVTQQHTFVQVDANGSQIAKWVGSPTLEALLTKVQ